MKVTIQLTDDGTIEIADAVKPPWKWRSFLVIDRGVPGQLTYVPIERVDTLDIEGVVL
jgi:hypothetical protein